MLMTMMMMTMMIDDDDDGDGDDADLAIAMNTSVFDLSEEKPRRRVKEGKDLGKYV